jgi:hypothetical protein
MPSRSASGPRHGILSAQTPARSTALFAILVLLLLSACGSARQGSRPAMAVLTEDEIMTATGSSALDVVQQLRPQFLRARGSRTLQNPAAGEPVIYVDNLRLGGIEALRTIRASEVHEIRYLSPSEATTRFGTGHLGGAITVVLRRS